MLWGADDGVGHGVMGSIIARDDVEEEVVESQASRHESKCLTHLMFIIGSVETGMQQVVRSRILVQRMRSDGARYACPNDERVGVRCC